MAPYALHTVASAPEGSKATLHAIEKGLGFLPNLFAAMAESPQALNGYVGLEAVLARGTFDAAERQLLLTAISSENGCGYCVAVHSTLASMVRADAAAIAGARGESIPADPRLRALTTFARAVVRQRGHVGDEALEDFLRAGFTKAQALEIVANVGYKTISNFITGFAHPPLDAQFESQRVPELQAAR
jgi:uncharacterized peroxidase-related enzyme